MIHAIVGANWGDEGKGKITDMLATTADVVVRFQGGANAGHTIINEYGRFALHLLPSGVFNQKVSNIIANGVAFDPRKFIEEYQYLIDAKIPTPKIMVSDRAQIVMPYHILFDVYEEERLGKDSFGSTKSGIAPFYADKYAKIGFQVGELLDLHSLRKKLKGILEVKNLIITQLYQKPALDLEDIMAELELWQKQIKPFIADTTSFLAQAVKEDQEILLEGQLGSLRDPDFGIYPYTTSSHTIAGYGACGAGVPPAKIKDIVAVTKAYSSAVGAGPFVSEIFGEEAEKMRRHGGDKGEYGATTGRPRRMGWFDCVATRYGVLVQGADRIVLTAIDCLSYLDEIKLCVAYEVEGKETRDFPSPSKLKNAKPILKTLPGWKEDIRGIKDFDLLPQAAKDYVNFINEELGGKIKMVSNGPHRDEIIFLD